MMISQYWYKGMMIFAIPDTVWHNIEVVLWLRGGQEAINYVNSEANTWHF